MDGYDEPLVMLRTFGSGVFLFLGTAVVFRWAVEYKEAPRNSCETVIKKDLQLKKFEKLNKLHIMIVLH